MVYCEMAVKASFTGYPVFNEKNTPMLVHKVSEAFESKKPGEEIVLFLDGELIPLIHSVEQGMHIALNRHSGVTNRKDVAGSGSLFPIRLREIRSHTIRLR
ncbi:hypothetical protein [Paenibacillus alvei]|uniref:Uncharacterized protein n=1 Tax=Paenibacillus alvei TaxID=44250 RepID=A0AAP7A7M4_PAEAL|nr:hypothetical protein [Paenibacillus alvei]NOJ74042.1 hypothetical protein [Paenibacillus alvei]